jgi:hypothetical protein
MLKAVIKNKLFLALFVIVALIDLSYPITITFDSGHYMSLAHVINTQNWVDWDPVRGIVFPLFLCLSTKLLGYNQNALLVWMTLAHLLLFVFSVSFILYETKITKPLFRNIVIVVVFLFIILDPLILGIYHTMLTEFFAATIAVISTFFAHSLYQHSKCIPKLSKKLLYSYAFFLVMVPIAWHLKQPYVGAAYFPFLLSCCLILLRNPKMRTLYLGIIANILIVISLGISIIAWNGFLPNTGLAANPNRSINSYIDYSYEKGKGVWDNSPIGFIKKTIDQYLLAANVYWLNHNNNTLVREFSLTRAYQNKLIGYKMFANYSKTNTFYMTDTLNSYIYYFTTDYYPPKWFNKVEERQLIKSNFMFSTTYLVMPFFFLAFILIKVIKMSEKGVLFIILSGSATLNAFFHALAGKGLDRYLQWGYPLNLICIVILAIYFSSAIIQIPNIVKQRLNKKSTEEHGMLTGR